MSADPAIAAFTVLPVALAAALVWAVAVAWYRSGAALSNAIWIGAGTGLAAIAWMSATWHAARVGLLAGWEQRPPPFALLVGAVLILAALLAASAVGARLARTVPLWALVLVQGFRLPLELAMHAMYERGVMPEQMSYSGLNFDIATGASAFVVAAVSAARPPAARLVAAWNIMGFLLLVNIITVAVLSTPVFRVFGEHRLNVWVTQVPFVWLPAVLVLAALAGHLVIFRALRQQR